MGFDNECIPNIQSLAGEYFCPVCRLLVYPNEALQSQCTHLYCKPCLTYVVSTTRACPYDGYLVTEADSKPLVESNKTLAETIGKIMVHCLFHRSGCTWQGPLSDCTAHCSACAFGNSPVVCNRCGTQIVHRQVQEHAQNCPSVQPQAQQAEGGQVSAATADQTQITSQASTGTSQAQACQATTSSATGQDLNQQANPKSQSQSVSQAAVVTSEQWYQQQQQQYQQYYQQYSGYDQYYQQYYPYQQQAVPQYQQQPLLASQVAGQHSLHLQIHPQPQLQVQTQPQVQSQAQPQPQAQPQSHSTVQAPLAAQPQNQAQVNQQQQTHLMVPSHSQIQSQTYATGHPHPQVQPFPQAQTHPLVQTIQPQVQNGQVPQYQQHHSQMQQQIQQPQPQPHSQLYPVQSQSHSQAQPQVQIQPQPIPQPQLQLHPQPSQSVNPNLIPQVQHPAVHSVTGHQSYPVSQPQQQVQLVSPQSSLHLPAQGGPLPQQPPQMLPPQSHAAIPNQQQPGLLPLPTPVPQQAHPQSLQPAVPVQQRPVMQPPASSMPLQYLQQQPLSAQPLGLAQPQIYQQGPFTQQQQSLQSQLRPLGPPHSLQQTSHPCPQPQQNVGGSHAVYTHPSHNIFGRPMAPNPGVQSQPYPQSAAGMVLKPVQLGANQPSSYQNNVLRTNNQSGVTLQPASEMPGDHGTNKYVAVQQANSSSQGIAKKGLNELDAASILGSDVVDSSTSKSNADLKPVDEKPNADVADNGSGLDVSTKKTPDSRQTELELQRDPASKITDKGEAIENQKDVDNGEHNVEENKIKDGPLLKSPLEQDAKLGEEQNESMQKEKIIPQDQGNSKGPTANGMIGIPPSSQLQSGGFLQHSHLVSISDQGKHQSLPMPHGSNNNQQRPAAPAMLQAPPLEYPLHAPTLGRPHNQFRPQGPGQSLVPPENFVPGSFGRGQSSYGPQGPYNQGPSGAPRVSQGETLVRPPFGTPPPNAFDSHGAPSYGPEGHLVQQRAANMADNHADNRWLGPRASDLDSSSTFGLHGERLKPAQDERLNQLPLERARHVGDRGQFEEDLKQFPRPSRMDTDPVPKFGSYFSSRSLDRGPHGFGMDMGPRAQEKEPRALNFDPMVASGPRFLPPYHPDDAGRPGGLPEDAIGRPDFFGAVPNYSRNRMDGFVSRSPGREYPGVSPQRFGGHPGDDMDGREHRFNDRFLGVPGRNRDGFENPDHMAKHMRSHDMIGPDIQPPHFRRGEHLGHHNMPGHMRMGGEPTGYGGFSSHERMGEFGGPGNFRHPRLGEPGFRSSFSLREYHNDGGIYTGDIGSFENLRKRKPVSMGWCRICKVDCETVEGLDLHSQTREHQKVAMDMVLTIKQNAKKQKLTSGDHSISNDSSKVKNAKFEGRVNKH